MYNTDRIVELLRQAEKPITPNLNDVASASLAAGAAPIGINPLDAYNKSIDSSKQDVMNQQNTTLKAEGTIYEMMKSEADRGNAQADYVMKGVMELSGGDPQKANQLLTEMHKDPHEINQTNFLSKAIPAAAKLGFTATVAPVKLGENESLVNPKTGDIVAHGTGVNKTADGKQKLEDILSETLNLNNTLRQEGGAIESNPKGMIATGKNILNYAAGTGYGQGVAKAFGTEQQSVRNRIAAKIPLISAAIKNATGMSSQQMNSNFELQQYMKALSSPTNDYQANSEILKDLSKTFGLGTVGGAQKVNPSIEGPVSSDPLGIR